MKTQRSVTAPADSRAKRLQSRAYRKTFKRMASSVKTLKGIHGRLSGADRRLVHALLEPIAEFDDSRRMRSPSERVAETLKDNAAPKSSMTY